MTEAAISTEIRLTPENIKFLPENVRRPAYQRDHLKPGILHLGVGAFHRCHQAEWTDDALEAEFGDWGVVGVNLRQPDLAPILGQQDGLYCRELRENGSVDRRLIGSIIETISVLDADQDPEQKTLNKALEAAADPAIRVITMTVTEKGYCHIPSTGELNEQHPDIIHDIANPRQPRSLPGFVVRMLAMRFERGDSPPTIMSCDNVPDNGATLRRCVLALARLTDEMLADRISNDVEFLNTMVDRIVPATRKPDLDNFRAQTGVEDAGLVVGEPYRMWVIEDKNGADLPAWHKAGALIVDDVLPYEILKMRVLNGIQSNVCQLGLLSGLEFMSDVMMRDEFAQFAHRTITDEVVPHLPHIPDIDVTAYVAQSIQRLKNTDLRHSVLQISTDGSQKIKQRLLEPIRDALRAGTPCDGLLLGVAGWMQYAGGVNWRGEPLDVRDPLAAQTKRIARENSGDVAAFVKAMLGIEAVFGTDLIRDEKVSDKLTALLSALVSQPADVLVRSYLSRSK